MTKRRAGALRSGMLTSVAFRFIVHAPIPIAMPAAAIHVSIQACGVDVKPATKAAANAATSHTDATPARYCGERSGALHRLSDVMEVGRSLPFDRGGLGLSFTLGKRRRHQAQVSLLSLSQSSTLPYKAPSTPKPGSQSATPSSDAGCRNNRFLGSCGLPSSGEGREDET